MKERLIELLKDYGYPNPSGMATYLLENGVIVPTVKIGQKVYMPTVDVLECEPYINAGTVFAIGIDKAKTMWISVRYKDGLKYYHNSSHFGKNVFLTKAEAEAELERRRT